MFVNKYPLPISYVIKTPIWGGTELAERYGKISDSKTIGESWELTVRKAEMSVITGGEYAGMTLGEYIKKSGGSAIGTGYDENSDFPMLIKYIDAADTLSVQVHPDDDYAARVENGVGKTEMWYIVDAKPGAELIMGLADRATPEMLRKRVSEGGDIVGLLNHVPVQSGDCFFIPSGMVHAIGKGILIAEIQQNCDLTYRVWDFGRLGLDGKPRELHTEKACDVIRNIDKKEVESRRFSNLCTSVDKRTVLASCEYFTVIKSNGNDSFVADDKSFHSVICFEGKGRLVWQGGEVAVTAGDSLFIPAGMGEYRLCGDMKSLISKL